MKRFGVKRHHGSRSSQSRPVIRHENAQLGAGAGISTGPIDAPGHNAFPMASPSSRPSFQDGASARPSMSEASGARPRPSMADEAPGPMLWPAAPSPSPGPALSPRPDYAVSSATPMVSPGTVPGAAPYQDTMASASISPRAPGPDLGMMPYMPGAHGRGAADVPPGRPSLDVPPGRPSLDMPPPAMGRPSLDLTAPQAMLGRTMIDTPPPMGRPSLAEPPDAGAHLDVPVSGRPSVAASPGVSPQRGASPAPSPSVSRPVRRDLAQGHEIGARTSSGGVAAAKPLPPPSPAPDAPTPSVAVPALGGGAGPWAGPSAPTPLRTPAVHVGSLTQDRELAQLREQQKRRLLRYADREASHAGRGGPRAPMAPGASRSVDLYMERTDDPRFRGLHAVLRKLKSEWGFLLDANFNAVRLSLALLPQGELHAHADEFRSLSALIESSLQGTLDDHYESFATAITVNHGMISSLSTSQDGIARAREQLQGARDALGARRADLVQMWQRQQQVKEALRVLALLEQLRGVPDELESLMTEKKFFEATQLLCRSLKLSQREDLAELGATADVRAYLRSQEQALLDILIDEVQSHLYLKSYWCDARWRAYVPGQDALPDLVIGARPTGDGPEFAALAPFLASLHARQPGDASAAAHAHAEEDSFAYLDTLLASLAHLGKIGYALDTVAQLVSTELHQLVETTMDEVEARHESRGSSAPLKAATVLVAPHATHAVLDVGGGARRSLSLASAPAPRPSASAELATLHRDMEVMRDFVWTLLSKLEAVLAAHRVVQESAAVHMARARPDDDGAADRASAEPGVAALMKVWGAVCDELAALLRRHMIDERERTPASQRAPPLEVVLATHYERERHALFRLGAAAPGAKAGKAVLAASAHVDDALHAYVPGLVGAEAAPTYASVAAGARVHDDADAAHRRLVPPMVLLASVLLPPARHFVERAAALFPHEALVGDAGVGGGFLRALVYDEVLPQLGAQVQALVHAVCQAPDAYAPAARAGAPRPVARCAVQLVALLDNLYAMLQAAPFHRAAYTRVMVLALLTFYERGNDTFKALVAHDGGGWALAAVWAQRPALQAALTRSLEAAAAADAAALAAARRDEVDAELQLASGVTLRRADLLTSRKRQLALATFHHSLHWLGARLGRWAASADDAADVGDALRLPASAPVAALWDDVRRLLSVLETTVLMTLHVEMRVKTLYHLHLAVQGSYMCDALSMEPDSHVVDLNAELAASHEAFKGALAPPHHAYVVGGLDLLMDAVLTRAVALVPAVNRHGVTKMLRNLLSLQQNLKNMVDDPRAVELQRSQPLWESLTREPEDVLSQWHAHPPGYSHAEVLAAVRLALGLADDGAPLLQAGTTRRPVPDTRFKACVALAQQVAAG